MATMIRPNRMEVSDRFPVLGFTVKTDAAPWFEIAIASEPALLRSEGKDRRTKNNFYSSRAEGRLPIERGEAVYLVPQQALQRFAGQPKIYYGLATFNDAGGDAVATLRLPNEDSPWVNISALTGRSSRRRQIMGGGRNSYGENGNGYSPAVNGVLEWAGDMATPGTQPINGAVSAPTNGNGAAPISSPATPAPANGGVQPATPDAATSAAFDYDDGFGPMPLTSDDVSDQQGVQSTAMGLTNITHAGSYRLAYDRLKAHGYGVIEPEPGRSNRNFRGEPRLQAALDAWAPYITQVENAPAYILTGGLYVDKGGQHGAGLAIDVDGLWWSASDKFLANDAPTDWIRYLRLEATLRKVFGTVLNYDYNAAHHDHWHCDLGRPTHWRAAESQAKFAQRVLNEVFGKNLTVDGDWGPKSQADSISVGYDFSQEGEWDRFLDNLIQGVSVAAAQSFNVNSTTAHALEIVDPLYQPTGFLDALESWYEWGKKYSRWHAGVDDTTFSPHSAICQFQIYFPGESGRFFGTGFYISQDRILTCAHNFFHPQTGAKAEKIIITPGMNGDVKPFSSFEVYSSALTPHPSYLTHTGDSNDFDLGVISVESPPPNGWYFELEALNMSILEPIIVCGYPYRSRRYKNIILDWRKQRLDADTIQGLSDNMERFQYNLQTLGGNSGSPVYYVYAYNDEERQQSVLAVSAIGVHVSRAKVEGTNQFSDTLNQGCRLTEDKINWIWSVGSSSGTSAQAFSQNNLTAPGSGAIPVNKAWGNVHLVQDAGRANSWSEAAAMVVGWRDSMSVNPAQLGNGFDRTSVAQAGNLTLENHAAYTLKELCQMLERYGPLWVAPKDGNHPHAAVITGVCGDGTEDGTYVYFNDPWGENADSPGGPQQNPTPSSGSQYSRTFRQLASKFDPRPGGDPATATHMDVQLMHAASAGGRSMTKLNCSESGSYSMAAQSRSCSAGTCSSEAMSSDQSFYMNWNSVDLAPQLTGMSCWAAAAAMVVGWRERVCLIPEEIARGSGLWAAYRRGLSPSSIETLADAWGLVKEPLASYTVEGFRQMLENNGPVWIGVARPNSGHAVTVTGLYGDGTPGGTTVIYNDPWPVGTGQWRAEKRYADFMQEYEDLTMRIPSGGITAQILHAGGTDGRTIQYGASLSQAANANETCRPNTPDLAAGQGVAKSMQAVEIASAIVGATMSRILDNEGDVHWELDQLQGLKHIGDYPSNAGTAGYQNKTLKIAGPVASTALGFDKIYVDCEVVFQYNGRSLGNIQVSVVNNSDAMGGSLTVKENIMNDANTYTTVPATSARFAAVKLRFHYRFGWTWPHDDWIAITDLTLYGNGSYDIRRRWTQK